MKTTILKIMKNNLVVFTMLAIIFTGTTAMASTKLPDSSGKEVSVEFLGTSYGQPLFKLNIQNEGSEELIISLEDADGYSLYTQRVNEKSFTKKIRLATEETNIRLNLRIYSAKTKQSQVYEINKVTTTREDLVVTQVRY